MADKKKAKAIALAFASLAAVTLQSCNSGAGDSSPSGGGDFIGSDLKEIVYEESSNPRKIGSNVNLVIPVSSSAVTGAKLTAYVMMDTALENYNYYVVDWGDGTWSYNGPYVYDDAHKVLGEVYHTYKKAGSYQIRACGVNLALGTLYGWTAPQTLEVKGPDYTGSMIRSVKPVSSGSKSASTGAEIIE